jgi:hypothetical protein
MRHHAKTTGTLSRSFQGDQSMTRVRAAVLHAPRQQPDTNLLATREVVAGVNLDAQAAPLTSDAQYIPALIGLGSDPHQLIAAQHVAARRLLNYDGETYPHDGCAITLSVLLQEAGITVADTDQAIKLGEILKNNRGWQFISAGNQQAGDVGSTCGSVAHHGTDHIYLVLRVLNSDEMVIADNQAEAPHFRWASGRGGKSPTTFFLRAPR